MLLFSLRLLSFSPPSQQLGDFGCFQAVGGPVGIKSGEFWPCFARNPEMFPRYLFPNQDRFTSWISGFLEKHR